MEKETRRKIANWLLKIPGFIEAFDQIEDMRIGKTVALLVEDGQTKLPWPPAPSWLMNKKIDDWAKEEARIVISRLREIDTASVCFSDKGVHITFGEVEE